MIFKGFIGGSQTPISRSINTERTVNLIVEADPGTPKASPVNLLRPALKPFTCCGPGPVRSLFFQDGRFFAVSGSGYYEIFQSTNVTQRGAVTNDSRPGSISSNGSGGQQNFITSGGNGYIHTLDTNAFAQIADPEFLTPAAMGMYFETYFLNLQRGTNTFQLSAQLDGLNWNGLDRGQCSLSSDRKVAMALLQRTLMFAGSKNIEPWQNTGNAQFPIQPEPGILIEHGIAAPYSFTNLDNTLFWLGKDTQGRGIVWRFNGYTPERISTFPIENILNGWPMLEDALGFAFQINGHAYYLIYSPHNDTTLVYDVALGVWVEWAEWDDVNVQWVPWPGRCTAFGWDKVFIGDRSSGVIYTVETDLYEDEVVW